MSRRVSNQTMQGLTLTQTQLWLLMLMVHHKKVTGSHVKKGKCLESISAHTMAWQDRSSYPGSGSSSRASSKGKPLHWTSCMKIAEDIAAGLVHLHQSPPAGIVHGNLKPSNVLLGPDFESCLTDYGLVPTLLPSHADLASSVSVLYRAPETRASHLFTPASDVYSFGVLLLELLTGKAPFQDLVELHGDDIPSWVRAVREEETESGGESASAGGAEEKLSALTSIAAACVEADPARRPTTVEVLRMVREARAEAMSSSNSSDRSPARRPEAVPQGLGLGVPRDQGELHLHGEVLTR